MKLLWTIVFSIIFLAHVRSQTIVGTWVSDWQNQGLSDPSPANFTITSDNTIQYGCSSENTCPDDHDGNLEQQTTNIFADVYSGYMFTYSPETNTVSFVNDEYPQISLLYSFGGNTIPQTPALGTLGRTWTNKTQAIYPGNYGGCCVPDMIYVALTNPQYYLQAEFNAVFYYDTTTCSQTTTYNFQLSTTSPYNLTWDVTNSSAGISIVYAPASSKDDPSWDSDDSDIDWTFLISYLGECNYTYTPAIITSDLPVPTEANVNIVTWTQDWQTTPDKFSPTVYGVMQNNGKAPYTYMTTEISTFSQTILSYLVQTPEGQYFDPYLNKNGTTFTYNATTNTLLSISTNPDTEDALLLSPTGNLLNKTTFVNNWTNPITSAESSTCCIPSYIQITPDYSTLNQNRLSVEYYYPDGYSENEACNDFITNIEGGAFLDTVSVKIPSITQLTWTDSIGTQITWADPTNQTQLAVSIPGQCNLTMTMTSSPPPYTSSNPSTSPTSLSASWISSRVVGFIMGLFVMVNYI